MTDFAALKRVKHGFWPQADDLNLAVSASLTVGPTIKGTQTLPSFALFDTIKGSVPFICFHWVLAPNVKLQKATVPILIESTPAHAGDCAHTPACSAKGRMRWAQLLKRVLDIDIEHCPHCGGRLKLIAAIEEPAAVARILTHLGLAAPPPPRAPAVRVDLFQAACGAKPDWLGQRSERRSTDARANAPIRRKSGALGHNIVSDVERTIGFTWWRARLTA